MLYLLRVTQISIHYLRRLPRKKSKSGSAYWLFVHVSPMTRTGKAVLAKKHAWVPSFFFPRTKWVGRKIEGPTHVESPKTALPVRVMESIVQLNVFNVFFYNPVTGKVFPFTPVARNGDKPVRKKEKCVFYTLTAFDYLAKSWRQSPSHPCNRKFDFLNNCLRAKILKVWRLASSEMTFCLQ